MTTFAYVLMTYRNAGQVSRLVARMRELSPDAVLLVRHDARREPLARSSLSASAAELHEYRSAIDWGGWTMVEAQLRELRWLRANTDADYITFLSGQDYPIASLVDWEHRVTETRPDLQGEVRRIEYRPRWFRRGVGDRRARRAMYRYYRVRTRANLRPLKVLGPVVDTQRLPYSDQTLIGLRSPLRGLKLWWSLPWVTLSCEAADAVLAAGGNPKLPARFKRAFIPEESFIPTVLSNQGFRIIESQLTYCRFTYVSFHPVTFTLDDLRELTEAQAPFARKFDDSVDSRILDRLDEVVT